VLLGAALLLGSLARAENWPEWRGPRGNGVSAESAPLKWSEKENVLWRLPLPGPAGATPIIWGDRIFLTSVGDGGRLLLLAVSTAGKLLWEREVARGNEDVRGDEGNYASPSPVTDGERVWAFMGNGVLASYDLEGSEKWRLDLEERYGKFDIQFGLSSTPILDGGRLYLQLIHGKWSKEPSRGLVIALDKATGKEVWKEVRATDATAECKHSYASPILYRDGERAFLVTHGADYTIAHDLESGKEIWRCGGLNSKEKYHDTLRFVASPVANEGLIVIPTAKSEKVVAVRPDGKGDITASDRIAWELPKRTPDVPSPLIHDGLVYLCRENGVLICLDAKTGEKLYEERTVDDRHRASPVYAGGRIYLTARRGMVTVVKAGREFEILAQNTLGEDMSASPAISRGTMYLRTFDALYAVREGGAPAGAAGGR
jgi:outer membrane protein assembly factor BamB